MSGVVLQHVSHVVNIDEVVDPNNFYIVFFNCGTENQTANSTESVNTNFNL